MSFDLPEKKYHTQKNEEQNFKANLQAELTN